MRFSREYCASQHRGVLLSQPAKICLSTLYDLGEIKYIVLEKKRIFVLAGPLSVSLSLSSYLEIINCIKYNWQIVLYGRFLRINLTEFYQPYLMTNFIILSIVIVLKFEIVVFHNILTMNYVLSKPFNQWFCVE